MKNIPDNIKRKDVKKAIEKIRQEGVRKGREADKYLVEFKGVYYPPKYTISVANKEVNKDELKPNEFYSGKETNEYLENLGFDVVKFKPWQS